MALLIPIQNKIPQFGESCFLAPNATIIGDVTMGASCSVWFQAIVRGDVHKITIGNFVNIQDGAIIHATYQTHPTTIGDHVSIGHKALIHGCTLTNYILVGMGATILDGAVVEPYVFIGANSLVLEGSKLESGFLYAGTPAKKIKPLSPNLKTIIERTSKNYTMYASWYPQEDNA